MMPSSPISASWGMISSGKWETSSHSITCGAISPSANSRMLLRSCCCSSVKEKSTLPPGNKVLDIANQRIVYTGGGRAANCQRRNGSQNGTREILCPGAASLRSEVSDDVNGAFAAGAIHVAVGDETNGIECGVERKNAVWLERFAEFNRVQAGALAIEDHDIGFDGGCIQAKIWNGCDFLREIFRVGMVFVQAFG